jgi:hypothetical protein
MTTSLSQLLKAEITPGLIPRISPAWATFSLTSLKADEPECVIGKTVEKLSIGKKAYWVYFL